MAPRLFRCVLIVGFFSLLSACASIGGGGKGGTPYRPVAPAEAAPIVSGTMRPYQIGGRWYRPAEQPGYDEVGMASWYGAQFNGRPTATGERFDMNALTAAHKTLPLPGLVEVTNLDNGRRVILRVNDRGPFVDGRIIDLSRGAAQELDLLSRGVGRVRVRYLGRAPRMGGGAPMTQIAAASAPPASSTPVSVTPVSTPVVSTPVIQPVTMASVDVTADNYWVQAGAFSNQRAARRIADRLGERATVNVAEVEGRSLFRVLVGPWNDASAAESARQAVVARGYADAMLISAR